MHVINLFHFISTEQKFGDATNKHGVTSLNTSIKLDLETEELKHDRVPMDVGKIIQKGRNAKISSGYFEQILIGQRFPL